MKTCVLAAVVAAALAGSASGATFFGEDNNPTGIGTGGMPNAVAAHNTFLSGLVGVGTENFESQALGLGPPIPVNFVGAGTATLNGAANSVAIRNDPRTVAGRWATSGSQYVETNAGPSGNFSISFNNAGGVAAFGFYATDLGDFGNQLTLHFTRTDNTTYDVVVPHSTGTNGSTSGRGCFFGIIANASDVFKQVDFLNTPGGDDVFGFDDMTVGSLQQVLPLPTAAWLGFAGLAGAAVLRRRAVR